jgi:hypothetical protein
MTENDPVFGNMDYVNEPTSHERKVIRDIWFRIQSCMKVSGIRERMGNSGYDSTLITHEVNGPIMRVRTSPGKIRVETPDGRTGAWADVMDRKGWESAVSFILHLCGYDQPASMFRKTETLIKPLPSQDK